MTSPQRFIVGITGASGAAYAKRLIQLLIAAQKQVHLVVSPMGQRLLFDELGMESINLDVLCGLENAADQRDRIRLYPYRDVGAAIASGSFKTAGMVIAPCSGNTLSATASGSSSNLIHRAAQVTLKERRPLILLHREMPLSLIDIRNMAQVVEAGAIICPASPGYYMMPQSIDDLVDFVVGRVLDLLGVDHQLHVRWGEDHHPKDHPHEDAPKQTSKDDDHRSKDNCTMKP